MSRLSYQLFRRKLVSEHAYPPSTEDSLTLRGAATGVGYNTTYEDKSEAVLSRREFDLVVKEVGENYKLNNICQQVFKAKKAELMRGVTPAQYNILKIGFTLVVLPAGMGACISYIPSVLQVHDLMKVFLFILCGVAAVS